MNGKTPHEMASPENTCIDVIAGTLNKRKRLKKLKKNKTTNSYMTFFLLSSRSRWPCGSDSATSLFCAAFDSVRKY
jgi:hypothetical protein